MLEFFIICILTVLFYLFNIYLTDIAIEQKNKNYPATKYDKTLGYIIVGIIGLYASNCIENEIIAASLMLSSMFIILHGVVMNWKLYNNTTKMGITFAGILFIIYGLQSKNASNCITMVLCPDY